MRPSNNLEKKDSFRHILKSSASMYESSSSLFFRTTAGIQSGPDAFETVLQWNGASLLSLMESQSKLRQQNDQNFPMEGKPL